jgi:hypothetical protein
MYRTVRIARAPGTGHKAPLLYRAAQILPRRTNRYIKNHQVSIYILWLDDTLHALYVFTCNNFRVLSLSAEAGTPA